MKTSPVRLLIVGTVVYVAANPKARARVGELVGQARQKLDEKRGRTPAGYDGVQTVLQTPYGDVESEDRSGTWADDGGVVARPPGGSTSP